MDLRTHAAFPGFHGKIVECDKTTFEAPLLSSVALVVFDGYDSYCFEDSYAEAFEDGL